MLSRDIFCFIPACNETEAEAYRSIKTFRRESIKDYPISTRLRPIVILDGQKCDAPDTRTFVALKKLLGVKPENQGSAPAFVTEHGCRIFKGMLDDIPIRCMSKEIV